MVKTKLNLLETLLYRSHYDDAGYMIFQNDSKFDIQGLINIGLLRPTTPSEFYRCDCFDGGGEVIWVDNPKFEKPIPSVRCGCGFYRIEPEEIQRWEIVLSALLRKIGEAMGFSAPFNEVSPRLVWQLGRRKRRDFYYIRCVDFDVRRTLRDIFLPHPTAILIVPTMADIEFIDCLPNRCFPIEEIGTLDDSLRLTIDMTSIDAELEPVEDEPKRQRRRLVKIDQLIAELKKHYQEAKDYYYVSGGEILPRPTQQELAKRIGTSQDVVSRCLKDEKGVVLRTLWENAENLGAILNS
ncbi:MAG: helix-turn-helix domain-containing protein [Planctomycetaceae bacterium]|jgi:hypothetical protein|nr:helix-turn-helix domain-containing protein [Planctomycetaceae bacterium]